MVWTCDKEEINSLVWTDKTLTDNKYPSLLIVDRSQNSEYIHCFAIYQQCVFRLTSADMYSFIFVFFRFFVGAMSYLHAAVT